MLAHVSKNFYSNVIDLEDILSDMQREKEEQEQLKIARITQAYEKSNNSHYLNADFRHDKVTFYNELKEGSKTSYTFIEAMILVSGFLAAHNKESNDDNQFSCTKKSGKGKSRKIKKDNSTLTGGIHRISHTELGKTKKFSMERMLSILQFFISHYCQGSEEFKLHHHSINVYSKINTFVSENLFKRSQGRNEDPSAISLKINYDKHMVEEVLTQFPYIRLEEFLDSK